METRETITLDTRAQRRLTVLTHVLAGELTIDQAAAYLKLSRRQVRRLLEGLHREGASALVHGNRGRPPANRLDEAHRARLVELATTEYEGFNPVHMTEELAEDAPELAVSARSLRRILAGEGVIPPRTRRAPRHRSRRERMLRAGMLLQADGSRHDWLEGRGPWLTLVGAIDDATGVIPAAVFRDQEDAAGYFTVLAGTARHVGLPLALYTDRHGIFTKDPDRPPTLTEQLTGKRSLTQVGRALEVLGVRWIGARSPQAKGRSERSWGTLQDRLVSALRRAGASSREEADLVLERFLPRFNVRFGVPAAIDEPAWRPWPSPFPVEAELCFHYRRTVSRDATIAWGGADLAVPRRPDGASRAGRVVIVEEHLDGSLWMRDGAERHRLESAPAVAPLLRARGLRRPDGLDLEEAAELPATDEPPPPSVASVSRTQRPGPDHPWRAGYARRAGRPR
jgi:transposase